MERTLYEHLKLSCAGDEQSCLYLMSRFSLLLKKLAFRLVKHTPVEFEDAYADLCAELLVLIKSFDWTALRSKDDAAVVSFIAKSLQNYSTKAFRKYIETERITLWDDLSETEQKTAERNCHRVDEYEEGFWGYLKPLLTDKEFSVISDLYVKDYTVAQIAAEKNISRQAVNQLKLSAFHKLKKRLKTENGYE